MSIVRLKSFFTNRQTLALGFIFASMGGLFATWATALPSIKEKFGIDDHQLGLLLLFSPMGNMFINFFMAQIIGRIGAKKSTIIGSMLTASLYLLPTNIPNIYLLAATLFCIGSGVSLMNVGMNTCVTFIEKATGKPIMSTCHGMFSVGLMVASFLASISYAYGIKPAHYTFFFSGTMLTIFILIRPIILSIPKKEVRSRSKHRFKLPKGILVYITIIAICSNFLEGTMANWTTIYLRDIVSADKVFWGVGLTAYSLCMATGRFFGDWIIPTFGSKKIMFYSGVICFIGLLTPILFPSTLISILSFGFVGLGVSCMAPILYGAATKVPNLPEGAGLATMNTFSIGGFLFVPVLIGVISSLSNLQVAFSFILVLISVWIAIVRFGPIDQ